MTLTGQRARDKIRDVRLRRQLTGTIVRPRAIGPAPTQPPTQEWNPPAWLVQTLIASGEAPLLDAPPEKSNPISTSQSSGAASSSTDHQLPQARPPSARRALCGTDEVSLAQAVVAYWDSAIDDDEHNLVESELRDMGKERFEDPNMVEKTLNTLRDSVRVVTTLFDNVRKKNNGETR